MSKNIPDLPSNSAPALDDTIELYDQSTSSNKRITLADLMLLLNPAGVVVFTASASVPTGYLPCDGASLLRASYPALFAAIGTDHGSVDGTHFNVPNIKQRFILGKADSGTGTTLGATGGSIDHTHNLDTVTAIARIAMVADSGASTIHMNRRTGLTAWDATHDNATSLAFNGSTTSKTSGATLQGLTAANNPPFIVLNPIIKV